jgi:hypothetical protein
LLQQQLLMLLRPGQRSRRVFRGQLGASARQIDKNIPLERVSNLSQREGAGALIDLFAYQRVTKIRRDDSPMQERQGHLLNVDIHQFD